MKILGEQPALPAPAWRRLLVERLEELARGALPPEVRVSTARVMVDDLAAAVSALARPEVASFGARVGTDVGGATLLAGGRASAEQAAGANALAMGWEELDGGYRPAPCHGGLYAVPAALAEGEVREATVGAVLEAVAVGYELSATLARTFVAPQPMVFHPHAVLAPIGAAASVAWLRTRDPATTLAAAEVAVTLAAAGPFGHAARGVTARNLWASAGARHGFLAADAVASGLTGTAADAADPFATVLVDALGYAPAAEPVEVARWAVLDAYHKLYAACQYTHAGVEAAAHLAGDTTDRLDVDSIDRVVVATHPLALPLCDTKPRTALGGKFSLPHVVSVALATGRTDHDAFGDALLDDPQVAALRERVTLFALDPLPAPPHDRATRVEVVFRDGTSRAHTCASAVGSPDRPLDDAGLLRKVAHLTAGRAPRFADVSAELLDSAADDSSPTLAGAVSNLLGNLLDPTPS